MANDKKAEPDKKVEAVAVVAAAGALAIPDFVDRNDHRGSESIGAADIRLPRLGVAQANSPEVTRGDPKRIEGLEVGHMFSNLLQTNFGEGPVEVVVIRREPPRAMEFWPRNNPEGKKGIKDRNVRYIEKRHPKNDPRCNFGPDGEKPIATVFHEFVAFVVGTREPLILSFKSTSTGAADSLNTFLKLRGGPAFATTFRVYTALTRNEHGPFYVFRVQPGGPVDRETYDYAATLYDSMKGREVSVDEVEDDAPDAASGDVPF